MLKGILSISGQPGLFKMVAEAKNRIIVESLITGKRQPVGSTTKVSSLEDIAVYTDKGDIPLKGILKKIGENDPENQIGTKPLSDGEMKKEFEKAVPEYDKNRVYTSDIKKIFSWYILLRDKDLLDFSEEESENEEEAKTEENGGEAEKSE